MSFLSFQSVRTIASRLLILISVLALASCGGSGGGSSSGTNTGTTVSTDATLSAMTISSGSLSPSFAPATTTYSATVNYAVTSVTVNATTTDANATYKVNGGSSLKVGTNTIDVVVTAQNGSTKTYSITVTRKAANTDATLSALSISSGTLSPSFASATIKYTDSVGSTVSSVTVNATTTNSNATIKVNGATVASGTDSSPITLSSGTNTINIVVTAQDGSTTKHYSIIVTRVAGNNATLSALTISSGTLSPSFASATMGYTDSVANSVTSVTVSATTTDSDATLSVNSGTAATGTNSAVVSLGVGSTSIPVTVTSQDTSTSNTYTITVKRLPALSALSLNNASYTPVFQSTQLSYDSSVNFLVNAIGVTATSQDSGDTLTIGGKSATSGSMLSPVYLATGSSTVDTVVTSSDGQASQTYSIAMKRESLTSFKGSEQEWGESSPNSNDEFGSSVAISGDTMVVGADRWYNATTSSRTGAAFVYTYDTSSGKWVYQATLTAKAPTTGDYFGNSVAIDGNTIVVGAPHDGSGVSNAGAAYIFTRSGSSWTRQPTTLTASDATSGDKFGSSVSISGSSIVVGAPLHSGGEAYVFYGGSDWSSITSTVVTNQQILTGAAGDTFGTSVAIDGSTIVVGAPLHAIGGVATGAAYVFTGGSGTSWTQQTVLSASNGASSDKFGASVSVSGSSIAVGATGATGVSAGTGAAYVFTGSGASWTQQDEVWASNGANLDLFGNSIDLSGERLVVGADQKASNAGAVYVYMRDSSNTWTQSVDLTPSDASPYANFGISVGIDKDWLVTGAIGATVNSVASAGSVYAYQ